MGASGFTTQLTFSRLTELARFVVTGTLAVALNLTIIVFLTERLGLHYLAALALCFIVATLVSFMMNRRWTFRKRDGDSTGELARYVCVTLAHLALSVGLCFALVEWMGMPYVWAMGLLSIALVPVTYWMHRRWSFQLRWSEST